MSAVRICIQCERHNGPSFTHCMYCGVELSAPPLDPLDAQADRAQRLLDTLSPERRELLPDAFLTAVERQAELTTPEPSVVTTGSFRVTDSGEMRLSAVTGRTFLGPRRRDMPADRVTQPDFPALFPPTHDLTPPPNPSLDATLPPNPEPAPPPTPLRARTTTEPPARQRQPEPPAPQRQPEPPAPQSIPEASPQSSLTPTGWLVKKPLPRPPPVAPKIATPLQEALMSGSGPFGSRGATFRLVMVHDPGYEGRIHFLQHRLAQTLQMDLFTARQCLQRDVPTCLADGDDGLELQGQADHLRAGGVQVELLERGRWLSGSEPMLVVAASGGAPGPVSLVRPDGTELRVYRADLAWAAVARIEPDRDAVSMSRADWDATRAGAFPAGGSPYFMMDVLRHGSRAPLRVRADHFDFSCLGEERSMSGEVNLRKLLNWLSPDPETPLRVDDGFKRIRHKTGLQARGRLSDQAAAIASREVEFTEYVLLVDAAHRRE